MNTTISNMKSIPTLLILILCAASAQKAKAQAYGTIYPRYQGISTTGPNSGVNTGNLWDNAVGDSWSNPVWAYAYATVRAGYGDSQALVSVSNRNLFVAVTTSATLPAFMNGQAYSAYSTQDTGFGSASRTYGTKASFLNLADNTTVGFGIRGSRWSGYSARSAGTNYLTFLYSNWGYQPGNNPKVNNGNYSAIAWSRAGWLGPYSLNKPPLNMGSGYTRRWTIADFTTGIDTAGNNPYRYVFTTAQSLTASTASDIFIIPSTHKTRFLNGLSFSYYAKLFNTGNSQEVVLPAGRSLTIAVRDGVNTTSCEGAQVVVYAQYYR